MIGVYRGALDFCLGRGPSSSCLPRNGGGDGLLFVTSPKGFLPQEDIGQLSVADPGAAGHLLHRHERAAGKGRRASSPSLTSPTLARSSAAASGLDLQHRAACSSNSRPKATGRPRRHPRATSAVRSRRSPASPACLPVQNLRIGGVSSASQYQFVVQGIDRERARRLGNKLADAMAPRTRPSPTSPPTSRTMPQAQLVIDRKGAASSASRAEQLRNSLYDGFGTNQASTIYETGDNYEVIVEFDPSIPWTAERLERCRSARRSRKADSALGLRADRAAPGCSRSIRSANCRRSRSPSTCRRVSRSATRPTRIGAQARVGLPATITHQLCRNGAGFQDAVGEPGTAPALGRVLTIYIVLGILYESFIHPLTILTGLPAAAAGALLTLRIFGFDVSVIAMIGMLMLIGIVKKNAIMMIDFALVRQRAGAAPLEAIREACLIRFRPIMMTTMAAIMGSLPIAFGLGAARNCASRSASRWSAGSSSRRR